MLGNVNTLFFWHMLAYWSLSIFYYVCDWLVDMLKIHKAFKIQGERLERQGGIDWKKYHHAIRVVLANQIFISPLAWYSFSPLRGYLGVVENPGWYEYTYQMLGTFALNELIFFYTHMFLHRSWWYGHVHKIHHEWTMPVAVRAFYCHPVEYYMTNMTAGLLPPILMRMNDSQISLWLVLATLNLVKAHSGFLGWGSEEHDLHHEKFNVNFGTWNVLDRLHGTYEAVPRGSKSIALKKTM